METMVPADHGALALTLEKRVLDGPGLTDPHLRRAVADCAADAAEVRPPYGELARRIGQSPATVTDDQVAAVVAAAGSEKAAFEVIVSAALGAGLARWRRALAAMEAGDAAA
jgi:hypothetical protein